MEAGELVLGRFLIEERLGEGGFATVWRAWDERLERAVAVKVIDTGRAGDRVLREAQAAARLNHRSIVTLYELGQEGQSAYLVSELVDGRPLRELACEGLITDRDVAVAGAELCDALEHAHDRGVVHRDVKPENILLAAPENGGTPWSHRAFGRAMLADFGIASVRGAETLTRDGEVVGTLAYMAPEQAEGDEVGEQADVYSLALSLFECWTGSNPVAGRNPAETARAIGEPLPSLAELRPDLPLELCHEIDACLLPLPDDRPLADELRDLLAAVGPSLDDTQALPAADPDAPAAREPLGLTRPLAVVCLATAVAAAAWAGLPGAALVAGLATLPLVVFLSRPWEWAIPGLAPILGGLGLAPLYPAVTGAAESPRRAALLGLMGFIWLTLAQALLGVSVPLAGVDAAPSGWASSSAVTVDAVLSQLVTPEALAAAAVWTVSAAALSWILALRSIALRLLGSLAWAAALVAVHRLLPGWESEPTTAMAVALVVLVAVLFVSRLGLPWPRPPQAPQSVPEPGLLRANL